MTLRRIVRAAAGALVVAAALHTSTAAAQRNRQQQTFAPNMPYDGRYTFVRLRFALGSDAGGFRGMDVKWAHDYPRGETHFTKIVSELSSTRVRTAQSNILGLDDPELFKYPIAYMCEPGFWRPTETEVENLRAYLAKGGFIIFDDFAQQHWMNFEAQMRRVLPKARPVVLTTAHPIFDSFFRITNLDYEHPYYRGVRSVFYGYFEDNDPSKRLIAMVNYNNDMSEYWEFSDEGLFPLQASNEAYKFGVNYIIYALTR